MKGVAVVTGLAIGLGGALHGVGAHAQEGSPVEARAREGTSTGSTNSTAPGNLVSPADVDKPLGVKRAAASSAPGRPAEDLLPTPQSVLASIGWRPPLEPATPSSPNVTSPAADDGPPINQILADVGYKPPPAAATNPLDLAYVVGAALAGLIAFTSALVLMWAQFVRRLGVAWGLLVGAVPSIACAAVMAVISALLWPVAIVLPAVIALGRRRTKLISAPPTVSRKDREKALDILESIAAEAGFTPEEFERELQNAPPTETTGDVLRRMLSRQGFAGS